MVSAYVILSEPSERRISFRESKDADFEQNETPSITQGRLFAALRVTKRTEGLFRVLLTTTIRSGIIRVHQR